MVVADLLIELVHVDRLADGAVEEDLAACDGDRIALGPDRGLQRREFEGAWSGRAVHVRSLSE